MSGDQIPVSSPHAAGGFETLFELGRGGMGTAYLARSVGLGGFERLVVIKRMHADLLTRPEAVARFLDEARLAACIRHANVVVVQQVGQDEGGYFLVLEYVEGASLEELLDRAQLKSERIPPPIALRIALDACAGLHAAHHARDPGGRPLELLHRDISLQNLLVGRDGVTRVVDFGVARSSLGSVTTGEGVVLGKLQYLAPEYLRSEEVGPDMDVYGLGVTLWIALSGADPWPMADDAQIVAKILGEGMPPLASAMEVAPQIAALIDRACDPLRSGRFPSARAMAERIEEVGRETGWLASHGEVADYVERLAGTDLERRREVVSRRERDLGVMELSPPPAADGTPAIPLLPRRLRTVGSEDATVSASVLLPRERARWPYVLTLAVACAVGGALLFRVLSSGAHSVEPVGPGSVVASSEPGPLREPPPVASVRSAVEPALTANTVVEPPPARAAQARRSAPQVEPSVAPQSAVTPPKTTVSPPPPVPSAPASEGISTQNPYRKP